jgi:hypothetical protein
MIIFACAGKGDLDSSSLSEDTSSPDTVSGCTDNDDDGACAADDCDDGDPTTFPGAPEVCDEVDNDCDGDIDDGAGLIYYLDEDGDGYGAEPLQTCDPPAEYADNGADCDDDDSTAYPGAPEVSDGVDNDCDGSVDEDGGDPVTTIDLSWSGSGLRVTISGSAARYEIGMAETGAGSSGWYGESCIPGSEPYSYNDYGYDVCHSLSSSGGDIDTVSSLSDVRDGQTLFSPTFSPDLTYFIADPGSSDCWVSGDDINYFADFSCEPF